MSENISGITKGHISFRGFLCFHGKNPRTSVKTSVTSQKGHINFRSFLCFHGRVQKCAKIQGKRDIVDT